MQSPSSSRHSPRGIFCSRTLNLRSISAIGYDMDYTLMHYNVMVNQFHNVYACFEFFFSDSELHYMFTSKCPGYRLMSSSDILMLNEASDYR